MASDPDMTDTLLYFQKGTRRQLYTWGHMYVQTISGTQTSATTNLPATLAHSDVTAQASHHKDK